MYAIKSWVSLNRLALRDLSFSEESEGNYMILFAEPQKLNAALTFLPHSY